MNILITTDLYPISENDNVPYAIENFALGLKERDNNVTVVRPNFLANTFIRKHRIYKEKKYVRNNVEIYNLNFVLPFLDTNFNIDRNFDVIISHMPSGHIFAHLLNQKINLPHIAIIHQSDYDVLTKKRYGLYFKDRLKKAILSANLIGARNCYLKNKLKADFLLPSFIGKECIIKEKKLNTEKLKIITLSRLIKRKNITLVIKALKNANFDFEYNIFGDGEEKKNLELLVKKYNLESKVILHGKIPHKNIINELDENDVFILPSVNETFGISYLEAMSRGLITIGCKGTGIDGIIKDNINGYLIEPNENNILDILTKIKKENQTEIIKNTLLTVQCYEKEKVINQYIEKIKIAVNSNKTGIKI